MAKNNENQTEKGFENVEVALTKTEQLIEKHQKTITLATVALLVVIAIIWLVNTQFIAPQKAQAQAEIFNAQYYFEADSFALALNGDGMTPGFLDIIDEYGSTPAGKLAQYYAGVCYLNLGDFEAAKDMLGSYSSDDEVLSTMAKGLIGDAESELGNYDAAIAAYKKAIKGDNVVTAPIFLMKLGALYSTQGQKAEASQCFRDIKEKYPTSSQADLAEKYMLATK